MKVTDIKMGMPITVEVLGIGDAQKSIEKTMAFFETVDQRFSPYRDDSEVAEYVRDGRLDRRSSEFQAIMKLAAETKAASRGYFNVFHRGRFDPSGIVKGWAIQQAAVRLRADGWQNFYIDAGGDIQTSGLNQQGQAWRVGIRNPKNPSTIVQRVAVTGLGIATSGTYERGQHIYDPLTGSAAPDDLVSLTVVGPNVFEADRFATAAFAMGRSGLDFIERRAGLEGYMIDRDGQATMTSGFKPLIIQSC